MKPQALFKLLVVGGAAMGLMQGCEPPVLRPGTAGLTQTRLPDGGVVTTTTDDGGTDTETGGGVPGW